MACSILWYRRDLRIYDHRPLNQAVAEGLPIQPIFIFDKQILARFNNKYDKRLSFIVDSLIYLNEELKKNKGEILVFYGEPEEIILSLSSSLGATKIFAGEDFEPQTTKRDKNVAEKLDNINKQLILSIDHLLIEPRLVLKDNNKPYHVFTAYAKKWKALLLEENTIDYTIATNNRYLNHQYSGHLKLIDISQGPEFILKQIGYEYQKNLIFKPELANKRLQEFIKNKLLTYEEKRNFLALDGTSACSPYLRFGLISIRDCYRRAAKTQNSLSWINELIWREFYATILFKYPETINTEFQVQYRNLKWKNNNELFERFKEGMTGYPIIDAAMRQLKEIGWMHNRARMIVACFLSKILLMDWRLGEEHFAQYLLDYELASNVGGWQWAASVGTDAQPYFRIFNPFIQSRKFDPNGDYIRKYIPELRMIKDELIHTPHIYYEKIGKIKNYPDYIEDFYEARKRVVSFFKDQTEIDNT